MKLIPIILLTSLMVFSCKSGKVIIKPIEYETQDTNRITVVDTTVALDSTSIALQDGLLKNTNTTKTQKYFVEKADSLVLTQSHYVYIGDSVEAMVVLYDTTTMVLFTLEQVQKINNAYRLIDILEELVQKYGIEEEIGLAYINSLTNEVTILESHVIIKDNRIKEKDIVIAFLLAQIGEMDNERNKQTVINNNLAAENKALVKEVKRQKNQKIAVIIGGSTLILLITLLAAF